MEINEAFKKYPDNEPNYKGIHYMTFIEFNNEIVYGTTYFNDDCRFEPKRGKVVAFMDKSPKAILDSI